MRLYTITHTHTIIYTLPPDKHKCAIHVPHTHTHTHTQAHTHTHTHHTHSTDIYVHKHTHAPPAAQRGWNVACLLLKWKLAELRVYVGEQLWRIWF